MRLTRLRRLLGALLHDWPRLEMTLRGWGPYASAPFSWTRMRNRNEQLIPGEIGVRCDWMWTSDLHIAKVFPGAGKRLLARALKDFPIRFSSQPVQSGSPDVSFIIGHRGVERLPLLLATLETIASQRDVAVECIVVEQSDQQIAGPVLPSWVHYIHTPLPEPTLPFVRSWAFNVGAAAAGTDILIFHDNDMLVPDSYAFHAAMGIDDADFLDLKRFIFYLDEVSSRKVIESQGLDGDLRFDSVTQNLVSGGSLVASRAAYGEIGGFDESFVGWGGEDNEFWDRAETKATSRFGFLPIVHLWHAPQPERMDRSTAPAVIRFNELKRMDPHERIRRLRSQPGRAERNR